jgi:hypothetical protein
MKIRGIPHIAKRTILSGKVLEKIKNEETYNGCQNQIAEHFGPLVVAFYVNISTVLAAHN